MENINKTSVSVGIEAYCLFHSVKSIQRTDRFFYFVLTAVRILSDVDLCCVEPGVGEKTEDEEKRQRESGSENEVKEPVCPLDALH